MRPRSGWWWWWGVFGCERLTEVIRRVQYVLYQSVSAALLPRTNVWFLYAEAAGGHQNREKRNAVIVRNVMKVSAQSVFLSQFSLPKTEKTIFHNAHCLLKPLFIKKA